jgi:hypothetical protein
MGASWLTITAPIDRAVPQFFLEELISSGIQPILHIKPDLASPPHLGEMVPLFDAYAKWGVHYIALFDRPNTLHAWPPSLWTQEFLVERFLDIYLPLAYIVHLAGLIPVFPPLEPGGDYWDTAFLQMALQGIERRGNADFLESIVLGAYAWAGNRPLNWGAGGPERWPSAKPYTSVIGIEDQRGFRIFDWYLAIARAELDITPGILLLGAGCLNGDSQDPNYPPVDEAIHAQRNLAIAATLARTGEDLPPFDLINQLTLSRLEPIPPEVLACNFWLLAADRGNPSENEAWFKADDSNLLVVDLLQRLNANRKRRSSYDREYPGDAHKDLGTHRPISHYLLLPSYEWAISCEHLGALQPFLDEHHPTIGYSIAEAALAEEVTIISDTQEIPSAMIDTLRITGCIVNQIQMAGTIIATHLNVP